MQHALALLPLFLMSRAIMAHFLRGFSAAGSCLYFPDEQSKSTSQHNCQPKVANSPRSYFVTVTLSQKGLAPPRVLRKLQHCDPAANKLILEEGDSTRRLALLSARGLLASMTQKDTSKEQTHSSPAKPASGSDLAVGHETSPSRCRGTAAFLKSLLFILSKLVQADPISIILSPSHIPYGVAPYSPSPHALYDLLRTACTSCTFCRTYKHLISPYPRILARK
jgi:hypothetical protein